MMKKPAPKRAPVLIFARRVTVKIVWYPTSWNQNHSVIRPMIRRKIDQQHQRGDKDDHPAHLVWLGAYGLRSWVCLLKS